MSSSANETHGTDDDDIVTADEMGTFLFDYDIASEEGSNGPDYACAPAAVTRTARVAGRR